MSSLCPWARRSAQERGESWSSRHHHGTYPCVSDRRTPGVTAGRVGWVRSRPVVDQERAFVRQTPGEPTIPLDERGCRDRVPWWSVRRLLGSRQSAVQPDSWQRTLRTAGPDPNSSGEQLGPESTGTVALGSGVVAAEQPDPTLGLWQPNR